MPACIPCPRSTAVFSEPHSLPSAKTTWHIVAKLTCICCASRSLPAGFFEKKNVQQPVPNGVTSVESFRQSAKGTLPCFCPASGGKEYVSTLTTPERRARVELLVFRDCVLDSAQMRRRLSL